MHRPCGSASLRRLVHASARGASQRAGRLVDRGRSVGRSIQQERTAAGPRAGAGRMRPLQPAEKPPDCAPLGGNPAPGRAHPAPADRPPCSTGRQPRSPRSPPGSRNPQRCSPDRPPCSAEGTTVLARTPARLQSSSALLAGPISRGMWGIRARSSASRPAARAPAAAAGGCRSGEPRPATSNGRLPSAVMGRRDEVVRVAGATSDDSSRVAARGDRGERASSDPEPTRSTDARAATPNDRHRSTRHEGIVPS